MFIADDKDNQTRSRTCVRRRAVPCNCNSVLARFCPPRFGWRVQIAASSERQYGIGLQQTEELQSDTA